MHGHVFDFPGFEVFDALLQIIEVFDACLESPISPVPRPHVKCVLPAKSRACAYPDPDRLGSYSST